MSRVSSIPSACLCHLPDVGDWVVAPTPTTDGARNRFAPLLQKNATMEDPSRVIVTASIAGLDVGVLGEHATFGYSASKGSLHFPTRLTCR